MNTTLNLPGEKLTIIKNYGLVAKCEQSDEVVITEKPYLATKIQICSIDNLIISQPTLF